jgi:predicted phosphodiesterase
VRIAVFSDVHADLASLERVVSAIHRSGADELWCLGDIVGLGGRCPSECVETVRANCALVLAGNHDAWVAGTLSLDMLPLPRQRSELLSQRAALTEDQVNWLSSLVPYAERSGVEAWHGSADDPLSEGVSGSLAAAAHFCRQRMAIGLAGHTHRQSAARFANGAAEWLGPAEGSLPLRSADRWLLNPGAVLGAADWLEMSLGDGTAAWRRA